ncbi:MAG: hypothetical protein WA667_06140 [Candidatus Nitrosopolaris sp.]
MDGFRSNDDVTEDQITILEKQLTELIKQGHDRKALDLANTIFDIYLQSKKSNDLDYLPLRIVAEVYYANHEYEKVERCYQKMFEIVEKRFGVNSQQHSDILDKFLSRFFQIEAEKQSALNYVHRLRHSAQLYDSRGQYANAEPIYKKILEVLCYVETN